MIVREIASIALHAMFSDAELDALVAAFDVKRLRSQMLALGLCESQASDSQVAKLYFSQRCSAVSPNAYFDETWYVEKYKDVKTAVNSQGLISGFVHFIKRGLSEGRWPNSILAADAAACPAAERPLESINPALYLKLNPAAASFLEAFPSVTPLEHYNAYGRLLGYSADRRKEEQQNANEGFRVVQAAFDAEFYRKTYLAEASGTDPLNHYFCQGVKNGHSPNAWFDEAWYRAFYPEVQAACDEGWLPSGFFHYLYSGRVEGRQPKFDLTLALEAKMPGITTPSLLQRTAELSQRLNPTHGLPQLDNARRGHPTVWIFFPSLNPDIMYGGYRAVLWLVVALVRSGFTVSVVCLQEEPNLRYFLLQEKSEVVREVFRSLRTLNKDRFAAEVIGPSDRFVAYSVWDLPICARLASLTSHRQPLLLAQEYEPVFYDNGAHRALCEEIYKIPHFAIINSSLLRDYFAKRGLGVFSDPEEAARADNHLVFQHRINQLPRQSAASMRARSTRLLVMYARPEAHASRNVFEIAVLALQRLCTEKLFGPEWRFEGVGALSKLPPLELGAGHELVLRQKQSETDYSRMCGAMDIGISLMYAPHPSVMPFEFATTGALVVTNTYENRSPRQLKEICRNIVPCELSVESVAESIRKAVGMVQDFEAREREALIPPTASWDEIFTGELVERAFGRATAVHADADVITLPVVHTQGRHTRFVSKKAGVA